MTSYVLGIEIGTTSINVTIYNVDTKEIVDQYSQLTNCNVSVDVEGAQEQDVPKIIHVLNSCLEKIKPYFRRSVSKIGVCGQMHGVVLWKIENGEKPWKFVNKAYTIDERKVSNLYTWQDARCNPKFLESLPQPESHLGISTGFGIPTMFWLKKNDPKLLEKYNRSGLISSFVVAMLSNQDQVYTSFQNAASWGYFNCKDLQWNVPILEKSNFPVELLPEVKSSGVFVGNLSQSWYNIPTGIPIGVDLGNLQCSVLSTIETFEDAVIYLSSSAHVAFVINNYTPTNGPPKFEPLNFWPYFNNMYIGMADSLNGGNILTFFVNMLEAWFSDLGVNVERIKLWDTLTRLGMNVKSDPTLNISPTCLGERFDPQLTASVTNITGLNLSLGEVYKALCRGIVENLHSQLSLKILKKSKCNRLIGAGSALDKSLLLRNEVKRVYQLPLVFTLAGDASKGAALAIYKYGAAEATKSFLINNNSYDLPICFSKYETDDYSTDNTFQINGLPIDSKFHTYYHNSVDSTSQSQCQSSPPTTSDLPILSTTNKTNQYTFDDSSEFSQPSSSKYGNLQSKTYKTFSMDGDFQFSHTFSPIHSDLASSITTLRTSELPILSAKDKFNRKSDEDYNTFLLLQKADPPQNSDLPVEPKKYKHFSIDDASQFSHISTQINTDFPTSMITTTTKFQKKGKLRNGEIQKGTPRSGLSSEPPSFPRSVRIKTNDLASQQSTNLPINKIDYSTDDTYLYSVRTNDEPIGSREYKNYNWLKRTSQFLPTTSELRKSVINKTNHYMVDSYQKYPQTSTSQKYNELPIESKKYKTFSIDGASQFSRTSEQTTSDLATSMPRPTQYQLSEEDKLRNSEKQKTKLTPCLSYYTSTSSPTTTSELPITSTSNKTKHYKFYHYWDNSQESSTIRAKELANSSENYKTFSIDNAPQVSHTSSSSKNSDLPIIKTIQEKTKTTNDDIREYMKTSSPTSDLTPQSKFFDVSLNSEKHKTYNKIADLPRASSKLPANLPLSIPPSDISLATIKNDEKPKDLETSVKSSYVLASSSQSSDLAVSPSLKPSKDSDLRGSFTPVMSNILVNTIPPGLVQSTSNRDLIPASELSPDDSMLFWDNVPTLKTTISNHVQFSENQSSNPSNVESLFSTIIRLISAPFSALISISAPIEESDSEHFYTPIMSELLVTPSIPKDVPATLSTSSSGSGTTPVPTPNVP